jgi:hypothetical protein
MKAPFSSLMQIQVPTLLKLIGNEASMLQFTRPTISLRQICCTSTCGVVHDVAATTRTTLQSCNIETTRETTKLLVSITLFHEKLDQFFFQ